MGPASKLSNIRGKGIIPPTTRRPNREDNGQEVQAGLCPGDAIPVIHRE